MTVADLKKKLDEHPDDLEVFMDKPNVAGTVSEIEAVEESTYAFFGKELPCLLLCEPEMEAEASV